MLNNLPFFSTHPKIGRYVSLAVLVIGLTLLAVQPFLMGKFPETADGTLHLYRLISLDHAVQQGELWPRYVPGMAFGYGAPFFNYYSPFSLYPLEAFHLLGVSFIEAWTWGFVFYALIGTWGAYLLGRDWLGTVGGLATAVAYTYAPYTLFDSIWRGTVSECASLALLPWVFWAFHQWAVHRRRRDGLLAVLCFVLFILMHNVITLHSAALLGVYCLYLGWMREQKIRTFARLMVAFILALGLTAFFWLPAIAETDYVKINGVTTNLATIDVVNNLTKLGDVFALPVTADPTQLQPPVAVALGWPQIILGVLALLLVTVPAPNWKWPIWGDRFAGTRQAASDMFTPSSTTRELRGLLWLAAMLVLALVFMNTGASAFLWQNIPLIRYSQFPWRLLGPASLLLALLAGAGVVLIMQRLAASRWKILWFAGCLAGMMLYAVPWLYTIYLPDPAADSIVDAQNFERETGWIATSSFGEYLPRWNTKLPDSERLIARYAETAVIPRLEVPANVALESADWGMTHADLLLNNEADDAVNLTFDWFYFPGWWATLDGESIPLEPGTPEGLITLSLPTGAHRLEIGLGLTGLQLMATAFSGVALLGFIVFLIVINKSTDQQLTLTSDKQPIPYSTAVYGAITVSLLLLIIKIGIIDPNQTPLKRERFAAGIENGLQIPIQVNFANQITLLGYDLPTAQAASGNTISFNLYWQLYGEAIDADYSSVLHLVDRAGNIVAETGSFYPGELATGNWLPGYYIQERLSLEIPLGTPPGDYTLQVGLYTPTDQHSLDVINSQGNPDGVAANLGSLTVTRPEESLSVDNLTGLNAITMNPTTDLRLLGIASLPNAQEVGAAFSLEWYWQATANPETDYQAQLLWVSAEGEVAAESPAIPLAIGYAVDQWQAGDIWRGLHALYVPGRLSAGTYTLVVQVIDPQESPVGEGVAIGTMQVSTPTRQLDLPEMTYSADTCWVNGICLLGYDLPETRIAPGAAVNLTLYWQPETDLYTSLRIFVHLVDTEEHIVAQQDQIPAGWTRPTTGWSPGEIITEVYHLPIIEDALPGEYRLKVGWYDPLTGERITQAEGDVWLLPASIEIVAED